MRKYAAVHGGFLGGVPRIVRVRNYDTEEATETANNLEDSENRAWSLDTP